MLVETSYPPNISRGYASQPLYTKDNIASYVDVTMGIWVTRADCNEMLVNKRFVSKISIDSL